MVPVLSVITLHVQKYTRSSASQSRKKCSENSSPVPKHIQLDSISDSHILSWLQHRDIAMPAT